jgi:hypothetical protein
VAVVGADRCRRLRAGAVVDAVQASLVASDTAVRQLRRAVEDRPWVDQELDDQVAWARRVAVVEVDPRVVEHIVAEVEVDRQVVEHIAAAAWAPAGLAWGVDHSFRPAVVAAWEVPRRRVVDRVAVARGVADHPHCGAWVRAAPGRQ